MESSIYLSRMGGEWVANHRGPLARTTIDALGTACVPTAWRSSAAAGTVGAEIARLNPGVYVYTVEGDLVRGWAVCSECVRPGLLDTLEGGRMVCQGCQYEARRAVSS